MTSSFRDNRRGWFLIAALVVAALAAGRIWWLPAHAPLNVNEGWNAGHVARAFGVGALYPAPDALIANNYPPLSFLIVGLVERMVGDAIVAGRLVSLFSAIAVGAAVHVAIVRLVRDVRWAFAGTLLFAGFAVTLLRGYVAMNDPQWLGQAGMAWAFVLLLPQRTGENLRSSRIVAAAALSVVSGLVKHNLIAIPIAATLWLWFTDRQALRMWIFAGVVFAATASAALLAIWGTAVFTDVLAPARSYSPLRMAAHGIPLLFLLLPGLLAGRPLPEAARTDRRILFVLLLLAIAVPTAIVQRSGDGVDINATFETIFALSVAVPVACCLRARRSWQWLGVAALPAVALIPVAAIADMKELTRRGAAERRWQPFITRIAAMPGPVACDDQAICHWAGRQSGMDFFALKQRMLKGEVPGLETALKEHRFAMISMRSENRGWHKNRLIPLIRTYYRTVHADGGHELLVPRQVAASGSSRVSGSFDRRFQRRL